MPDIVKDKNVMIFLIKKNITLNLYIHKMFHS